MTEKERGSWRTKRRGVRGAELSFSSAGHMLPADPLPVSLWGRVSEWNMALRPEPEMHQERHLPLLLPHLLLLPPGFFTCPPSCRWADTRARGSSEDERSAIKHIRVAECWWKIKICSDLAGVAPYSTVLTVQSWKKREEVGDYLAANTGTADWGCWGQQDYIIENTVTPLTEEELPTAFSVLSPQNIWL